MGQDCRIQKYGSRLGDTVFRSGSGLQIYFNFSPDIIIFVVRMYMMRLYKFMKPTLNFGFSKLKAAPIAPKPISPGFKAPPPTLKSAPLAQPSLKKDPKSQKAGLAQTETEQIAPVIKRKHAVVTIMGHVDHGKTTLIDFLRKSDIAAKEDGGITQRIGAFRINCMGQRITFIDTPGHQAFVNMRQRGASVTDLVVLVVSAVQGVKKQTLQVIELIKKMQIPVIVAINKIDLPQANPEQTQSQLEKAGLKLEINGGDIPVVHISAKNGINVDLLCELIVDETKEATAIYNGLVYASVLEAFQTKEGLNSMTIIVEKGVLKTNAILIMGKQSFRVKTILDDKGENLTEAAPGDAVQVVGIPFIPAPGDIVFEVENDKKAKFMLSQNVAKIYEAERSIKSEQKQITNSKIHFQKSREGKKQKRAFCRGIREVWMNKFAQQQQKIMTKIEELKKRPTDEVIEMAIMQLEDELEKHQQYVHQYLRNTGDSPDTLNFIMKFADRGMEETILMQLQKLKPSIEAETKVKLNLIRTDVGEVTINDLEQAKNCRATVFTYGSGVSVEARNHLQGMEPPRTHKLIHTLLKDLKDASMAKKLAAIKGVQRARCEIAQIYTIKLKKKESTIPGIKVTAGKVTKKCKAYIFRAGLPVTAGMDISFIKSFKKDMLELKKGQQGTIGFVQDTADFQKGDQLVFYEQF